MNNNTDTKPADDRTPSSPAVEIVDLFASYVITAGVFIIFAFFLYGTYLKDRPETTKMVTGEAELESTELEGETNSDFPPPRNIPEPEIPEVLDLPAGALPPPSAGGSL